MERRRPLAQKKGLKRGASLRSNGSLKSRKGLTTKKSLQPRSKKMKKVYEERSAFVKEFLTLYPKCQAYWDENCFEWATDVHEILPRSMGGKIVGDNQNRYMALCRYCHTQITVNPQEAHRRGFRKWSWET